MQSKVPIGTQDLKIIQSIILTSTVKPCKSYMREIMKFWNVPIYIHGIIEIMSRILFKNVKFVIFPEEKIIRNCVVKVPNGLKRNRPSSLIRTLKTLSALRKKWSFYHYRFIKCLCLRIVKERMYLICDQICI